MTEASREARMLATFARLADTLVADFDVVDLLQTLVDTCTEVLETAAAGILLADGAGELELLASTSEAGRLVEVMQLSAHAGPCIESFRTGRVVSIPDISHAPPAWASFRDLAIEQGFASVDAVPMRLRDATVGTLNLFRTRPGEMHPRDVLAARALADVATIGILHERTMRESAILAEQLQRALNRRIVIEQAKGVVSHTHGVPVDRAYTLIRDYARAHQLPVSQVAASLVNMSLDLDGKIPPPHA